jgi:Flp pilus assembly pilin Flp
MIDFFKTFSLLTNRRGVVSVEYALGMVIAACIMIGVQALFEQMSLGILDRFIEWVRIFP